MSSVGPIKRDDRDQSRGTKGAYVEREDVVVNVAKVIARRDTRFLGIYDIR